MATAATAGCLNNRPSTSKTGMFSPPRMTMSFSGPAMRDVAIVIHARDIAGVDPRSGEMSASPGRLRYPRSRSSRGPARRPRRRGARPPAWGVDYTHLHAKQRDAIGRGDFLLGVFRTRVVVTAPFSGHAPTGNDRGSEHVSGLRHQRARDRARPRRRRRAASACRRRPFPRSR